MSDKDKAVSGRRVSLPGARREGSLQTFSFAGRKIPFHPGETIAAALLAAGEVAMRRTRTGERRGPFCGMGVCGECLVAVGGRQLRACLEKAEPGQDVTPAEARADNREGTEPRARAVLHEPDLLIIGAGPASLAAAAEAARAGADVLVIDERSQPGGQYFKQPAEGFSIDEPKLDKQFRAGRALIAEAAAAGARFAYRTTAWAARAEPLEVFAAGAGGPLRIRPKLLFLAQGAYELSVAVPGWTLPGVMTTGAAQTFLRAYMTAPGDRILIAGNGPLNLQLARELSDAGAEVVAVAEAAPMPGPGQAGHLLAMARTAPGLVRDGVSHRAALARRGVPVLHGMALSRVEGEGKVSAAVLSRIDKDGRPVPGTERRFEADTVCMGYGFAPQSELARALGCAFVPDPRTGALMAERADDGSTSVEGVFVIGDGGGLGGAPAAMAQGRLAGNAACRRLGKKGDEAAEALARRQLSEARRFQKALWGLYAAPAIVAQAALEDTLLCRCEAVTMGALQAARDSGMGDIGSLKRATRAGMGRCQGRYCGRKLNGFVEGDRQSEAAVFAPRSPAKPVTLGDVAAFAPAPEVTS
jgi:thioredoxin reductase